ncbi:MAG TPA: hypothetical protein VGS19_25875 [Streptosporangiaceae bacterium]|nr:hypothetical protein [Streptosporangiaceae bacterium]
MRTQARAALAGCAAAAALVTFTGQALAAGSGPAAHRAGPLTWSVVPSPNPGTANDDVFRGVTCLSGSDCTAVGFFTARKGSLRSETLAESWNGTKWSVVPSPSTGGSDYLTGVSCVSDSDCTAVGVHNLDNVAGTVKTLTESWDGTAWSVVPSPNSGKVDQLEGVSCVSGTDCVAVGFSRATPLASSQTLIESWDGTAWSVVPSPSLGTDDTLNSVSCLSASDCTAVGFYDAANDLDIALIESWDGSTWSVVPSPSTGISDDLNSVDCVTATDCVATGQAFPNGVGATLIESWDGTAWSVVPGPSIRGTFDSLDGVSCVSATDCTAAGSANKNSLIESWDGTSWSKVPSHNPSPGFNSLLGISCPSATFCTAVGAGTITGPVSSSQTLVESGTSPATAK